MSIEIEFLEAAAALKVRGNADKQKAKIYKMYRSYIVHDGKKHLICVNRTQCRCRTEIELAEYLKHLTLQDEQDCPPAKKVMKWRDRMKQQNLMAKSLKNSSTNSVAIFLSTQKSSDS